MFARAPASSANLGPGFDTLAVALSLYVDVTLELAESLSIVSDGCGAGRYDDERHLGVRVAAGILGHTNFSMRVTSSIPVSRGLGSSAALAVAAAAAAGGKRSPRSRHGRRRPRGERRGLSSRGLGGGGVERSRSASSPANYRSMTPGASWSSCPTKNSPPPRLDRSCRASSPFATR